MLSEHQSGVINTGNILNVNKKAGQKTAEELFDCLKVTLTEPIVSKTGHVHRTGDDLSAKLSEHKREEIKVGAKVFLNRFSVDHLSAAIEHLLATLNVSSLDNLILAYHPSAEAAAAVVNGHATTNGSANGGGSGGGGADLAYSAEALVQLQQLWSVLERYAGGGQICQLGIADLDTVSLQQLHSAAGVKPTIAQINLSACCVVPPSLQEFCNANEIQLLTHSDPEEVVPSSTLDELSLGAFQHSWTSRYQVHIRCRGVLSAKGFIVGIAKK